MSSTKRQAFAFFTRRLCASSPAINTRRKFEKAIEKDSWSLTVFISPGTATETRALEAGVTPQALCDEFHVKHKAVYDWFEIGFDHFGRTTTEKQTEIVQDAFLKLHANGFLEERTTTQPYCEKHEGFLADRFVEGTCPKPVSAFLS